MRCQAKFYQVEAAAIPLYEWTQLIQWHLNSLLDLLEKLCSVAEGELEGFAVAHSLFKLQRQLSIR
jgi:hypothetical protein